MRLAGASVSILLLYAVSRRLDSASFWAAISGARITYLALALLLAGLAIFISALRWHTTLRLSGATVHPLATLRAMVIGHCFSTILFGAARGDLAKSLMYSRWYGFPLTQVIVTAPIDRSLALFGALIFGFFTVMAGLFAGGFGFLPWKELGVPLVGGGGLVAILFLACVGLRRWRSGGVSPLSRAIGQMRRMAARLLEDRRRGGWALLSAIAVQACLCAVMVLSLVAVTRTSIDFLAILWVFPAIAMMASFPIAIGGAGLREGTAYILLDLYGVPREDAVASALIVLACYFLWAGGGLAVWLNEERRYRSRLNLRPVRSLSVVIPTLNEETSLRETVQRVREGPEEVEVIVVDGGSRDGTVTVARRLGCVVFSSPAGRGTQMRLGGQRAHGDVVLFLHADTWLPPQAQAALFACLRDKTVVGGGFWKEFDTTTWIMAGSKLRCFLRMLLGGRVMGDQVLFVRREALERIGGVPAVPIMEEFELCRLLREEGRMALAGATVVTSSRRFLERGVLRTYLRMWRVTLQYYWGTPLETLASIYRGDRGGAPKDAGGEKAKVQALSVSVSEGRPHSMLSRQPHP